MLLKVSYLLLAYRCSDLIFKKVNLSHLTLISSILVGYKKSRAMQEARTGTKPKFDL